MQKVLVIRFSSIGDIVLTTPVIRCLKKQIPGISLHYITKEQYSSLLEPNPYIDRLFLIRSGVSEVIRKLQHENYDHIIDLHQNLRSASVILQLRKPRSTFNKINFSKWLAVRFKINWLPDVHIVDRYFGSVRKMGVKNDGHGLDFFFEEKEPGWPDGLRQFFRQPFIAWAIGARHATKIFPSGKISRVCSSISKPVVLIGGTEDRENGELIARSSGTHVYNACGELSIQGSARVIEKAEKVISNDSGMMHIAAALRKRILSIWGNTIPDFGMYPYQPGEGSSILEIKGLSCRPCSKLGFEQCPLKHFHCMNLIPEEKIVDFIRQ